MNKKVTSIIGYLGIVGWLIAYLAGDKEGAKFHLNQALVIVIGDVICAVCGFLPIVGGILFGIAAGLVLVYRIVGIIYACQEQDKELPFIGQFQLLK